MMRSAPKQQFVLALGLAIVIAAIVALIIAASRPSFYFEVSVRSSASGTAQAFYDIGKGINEPDSARLPLRASQSTAVYRFPLPDADYRSIRFDPLDHGNAEIGIKDARIADMAGRTVRAISLSEITVTNGVSRSGIAGDTLWLTLGPADKDSNLTVNLSPPVLLHSSTGLWFFIGRTFLLCFIAFIGVSVLWLTFAPAIWIRTRPAWQTVAAWAERRPRTALLIVAVVSVAISCYPIIFFGRSFVSGNMTSMLYPGPPGLPGYQDVETDDFKSSDFGAMMWQNLPYSFVEGRALTQQGELPLWNRYNSCGTTLLGQGQSMFGDPLHMLVLVAGEASWAWDIKFLLAKILFCWALGLAIYASSKHLPSAALLGFSSGFIGFFAYRFDHPAFFSLCYAPWIPLCWIELSQAASLRRSAGWMAGLLLASWVELTSGTVKEAYGLLIGMHGCGLLIFLKTPKVNTGKKLLLLAGAAIIFVLLAAPVILAFWSALKNSYTGYKDEARAWQIQPSMLTGFFDDIFYRAMNPAGLLFNPSTNFLILLGCVFALVNLKTLLREPVFAGMGFGALGSFAIVFGIIPPSLIKLVPMLNHIWHTDNVFSCALIIELIILAGFGVRSYVKRSAVRRSTWDLWLAVLILFALLGSYLGFIQAAQREPDTFVPPGSWKEHAWVFYAYAFSLIAAALTLLWLGKAVSQKPRWALLAGPLCLLCLAGLHWRHGFHLKTGLEQIDDVVVNPPVRVNFNSPSAAVTLVRNEPGPFRTVGFGYILFPGYNAMAGLESISGPDALINPFYRQLLVSSGINLPWGWRVEVGKTNFKSLLPMYDLLNIGFFLDDAGQPQSPDPHLVRIASLDLDVYKNQNSWPRAFFIDQVQHYNFVEDFLRLVNERPGSPLAAVQNDGVGSPRAEELPMAAGIAPKVSPATNYKLTNNTTTFTIDAPSAGIAVLTEAYVGRDFIARINGVPCDYFRVNHAFRGIKIPGPGRYEVSFSYWPKHFTASLVLFGLGALSLLVWAASTAFAPFLFRGRPGSMREVPL
jgi:hypothetical protein